MYIYIICYLPAHRAYSKLAGVQLSADNVIVPVVVVLVVTEVVVVVNQYRKYFGFLIVPGVSAVDARYRSSFLCLLLVGLIGMSSS
jgi:hypothetical protein